MSLCDLKYAGAYHDGITKYQLKNYFLNTKEEPTRHPKNRLLHLRFEDETLSKSSAQTLPKRKEAAASTLSTEKLDSLF